jgi:hypothetical protein
MLQNWSIRNRQFPDPARRVFEGSCYCDLPHSTLRWYNSIVASMLVGWRFAAISLTHFECCQACRNGGYVNSFPTHRKHVAERLQDRINVLTLVPEDERTRRWNHVATHIRTTGRSDYVSRKEIASGNEFFADLPEIKEHGRA